MKRETPTTLGLAYVMFRQVRAHIANDSDCAGDACKCAGHFKWHSRRPHQAAEAAGDYTHSRAPWRACWRPIITYLNSILCPISAMLNRLL